MKPLLIVALAVLTIEAGVLGGLYASGHWVADSVGRPHLIDFLGFWTAGKFVIDGNSAELYDWRKLYDAEVAIRGVDTGRFVAFAYPPISLLWLTPVATLPYSLAFFTFIAVTGGLYAYTISAITSRPEAAVLALAAPPALANIVPGQNGFLTAALVGAVLLHLEKRPQLSGVFLGLLTYKPHFGPLFALTLAIDQRWLAFVSAFGATLVLLGICWLAFGWPIFAAFLQGGAFTANALLVDGAVASSKMQSIYGLARTFGIRNELAWALHIPTAGVVSAACAWFWRQDTPYSLKAASLASATLLITPFVLIYDYPILIVALGFLWRAAPWDKTEWTVIALANAVMALAIVSPVPVGFLAPLCVLALVVRRAFGRNFPNSRSATYFAGKSTGSS